MIFQNRFWQGVGIAILGLFLWVGCTNRPEATSAPTAAPMIQTVTVLQTVEVEVTKLVIITATPEATAQATAVPTLVPSPTPANTSTDLHTADFAVFDEAWDIIRDQFDGPQPDSDVLLNSAIEGSMRSLGDQFTRYIPPEIAARLREDMSGSIQGIGAFVRETDDGLIQIVRPIDGQPADLVGLKANDIIVEVDGENIVGQSLDEVLLKVRGPEGTTVVIKVQREGEADLLEFTITRVRFEIPLIESKMLPEGIAYVRLTDFSRNADEQLRAALEELLAQNPKGLIFDLRDNPGGYVDQAVAVADAFLPTGSVFFERNQDGLDRAFTSDDGDLAEQIPLVVLINSGSASASEIVAGAIQDRERAILVGEVSFGKGSVQQVHQLSNGAELRVTIAHWYTPNNNTINKLGITPDIEVATPEDLGGDDDAQIQRAVEYLLTGQ